MILEMNNKEINVELEVGQETTISEILEKMSVACGFRVDYLTDNFGGLTEEDKSSKTSSLGIDNEGEALFTAFDIIEIDEYNQMNSKIKITNIETV